MKKNLFVGATVAALVVGCASAPDACTKAVATRRPASPSCRQSKMPFKLGVARYSMCERSLDEALDILQNIDCHYMGLMEGSIRYDASDADIAAYKARCAARGVEVVSVGPEYFSTEAQCQALFAFARRFGVTYVSVVPYEINPEWKEGMPERERRLESDRMMDVLEKCVKAYGIRAAVHNHGPDNAYLYPTAEAALKRIGSRDRRIGVCLDVGHERRAGLDPAAFIRKNPDRVVEVHLKNIKIDPVKNFAKEGPRGELDIPGILKALDETGFAGCCLIEFEKDFSANEAPLAESLGYYRGVCDALK